MSDESSFASLMQSAGAQATGRATRRLRAGDVVEASVIQVAQDSVFVDVGMPSDGRIQRAEFEDKDGTLRVRVGDRIRATVLDPRPDGPVLAVSFGHGGELDTASLELARACSTPIEGEVTKVNKGGLEVTLGGVRAFCPASQVELSHVADLSLYVGQKLEFKVIDVRDGGRNVVVSRRALLEDRRREAQAGAKERLVVGTDVECTVQSLSRHGAVVDIDGIEGFIHLSELAQRRVERAEDVVRIGERVSARVLSVEDGPKGTRVRLSLRALSQTEATASPAAPAEEVLVGTVTRAVQGGVFVQTSLGEGLIPLRELGLPPGADHRRACPPGKELKVVPMNRGGSKLSFSVTQVARVEERKNYREFAGTGPAAHGSALGSLGDLLRDKFKGVATSPEPAPSTTARAPAPASATPAAAKPPVSAQPGLGAIEPAPKPAVTTSPHPTTARPAQPSATPSQGSEPERAPKGFTDGVIRRRR